MLRTTALCCCLAAPLHAEIPTVEEVTATPGDDGWRFDVTLAHPDTGWDHYADGWGVFLPDGTELGVRVLAHPHVNEQPFTRSLNGVVIPDGVTEVLIRARCNLDGWSEEGTQVKLP